MNNPTPLSRLSRRTFLTVPIVAAVAGKFSSASSAAPLNDSGLLLNPSARDKAGIPITSWRTMESGFHNGPTTHFDHIDPEDFMRKAKAAHTECVVVQTKSHWGYAYYNTQVGERHPGLSFDLVERMVNAAHRNGLSVVAYYSGHVDMQAGLKHPDWQGRNADGSASWFGEQWDWCCCNSPYREYAQGMFREIFQKYPFDGLFIDGAPWPRWFGDALCYCPYCEAKFQKETGEPLRAGAGDPRAYRKRVEWLQNVSEQYLDEVYAIVRGQRPGLPIWLNHDDPLDMKTRVLRKTSCLYIEPLTSPSGLSVGSILLRGVNLPGPQVGIFWGGYVDAPVNTDLFRTAAIMMQGTRPRFITDEQNMPDGRQRDQFFQWAGPLQGYVEKVEPLLRDLQPITSLAILFSGATRDHLLATHKFTSSMVGGKFLPSLEGCTELLARTQYPLEILPSEDLPGGNLARFDLIALPETDALSEADCRALHGYVQEGGKIIATYRPGLFDDNLNQRPDFGLAETLGVNYAEEVTKYARKDGPGIYFQTNGHPLSAFLGAGETAILKKSEGPNPEFCTFVRVEGKAESILNYKPPYLVPDTSKHLFHSWNVAPPGNELIPMAATVYPCGKGKAVYIGVPLFRRYKPDLYWVDEWIRGLVTRLVPDPPIQVKGSPAAHAAFFRQGPNRVIVQLVNSLVWTAHGNAAPLPNLEIVGRADRFPARSAELIWPEKQVLTVEHGAKWQVKLPPVALHSIVAMEL